MDLSVNLSRNTKKMKGKKKIRSKVKGKYESRKSPFPKKKNQKKNKSRSQSKTITKGFPSKDNSFSNFRRSNLKIGMHSSRVIGVRSKTPVLGRLKWESTLKGQTGQSKLRRISENRKSWKAFEEESESEG